MLSQGLRGWVCIARVLIALFAAVSPALGEEAVSSLPPEDCVRRLRGARIAGMKGDAAKELEQLRLAVEGCPQEIEPLSKLIDYYRRHPRDEASYGKTLELFSRRLEDPEYRLPYGVLRYLVVNPAASESELSAILRNLERQLAEVEKADPDLLRIRVNLEQRLGRTADAARTLEQVWSQTGAEDLIWPLAMAYGELERWQEAERLLAPRVEQASSDLRYFYIRILGKLGRYTELLEQVEVLAASEEAGGFGLQPEDFRGLLTQVAWDLRDLGQDDRAEELFRRLQRQDPDDSHVRAAVLHLYASEDEAASHAEQLARSWEEQSDPNALLEEGTQRLTSGDAAGAIELLRRAAPEFPDLEAVWYNLGLAAYRLEDWATVDSALARATELNPERAQSFLYRGLALDKLERCGEAVVELERALVIDANLAIANYYLAVCYRKLGDQGAAAEALARYEATRQQ